MDKQKAVYGALFCCKIIDEAKDVNSEEIGKTLFWDLESDIGKYSMLDKTLSQLATPHNKS